MMPQISRSWRKWALPGVAFTAMVMAAPPGEEVGIDKPARSARSAMQQTSAATPSATEEHALSEAVHVELERLARLRHQPTPATSADTKGGAKIGNIFRATSWYVPPPPPPPQPLAPPPPPSAPPIPFTYLGRYEDAPIRLIILVSGDRMYTVAEGDVIDDTYRVDSVTAGRVGLTYLPLNIKQSLITGEAL